ncbi:MAG: hypothetical protein QM820_09080 [Minicystis sp.]
MEYACLYCCHITNAGAGNCGICGRAKVPIRLWSDYKDTPNLASVTNFNPPTRKVAFDVHVNAAAHEVYVVVKVSLSYEDYAGVKNGDQWVYQPVEWTGTQKTDFLKLFQASIGLWDGHHPVSCGGVNYTVMFFVESVTFWAHAEVRATASSLAIEKIGDTTENRLWTAGVSLLEPYPALMPAAASGTRPGPRLYTKRVAVKSVVKDSALADNHANQAHYNPMAHEFGHLLGLPDEYNVYGFAANTVPVAANYAANNESRPAAFWLKLLDNYGLALPGWGQYGTGLNQVQEHSIMRDAHTGAGGFLRRHYVTVLEALNYITAHNARGGLNGVWSI